MKNPFKSKIADLSDNIEFIAESSKTKNFYNYVNNCIGRGVSIVPIVADYGQGKSRMLFYQYHSLKKNKNVITIFVSIKSIVSDIPEKDYDYLMDFLTKTIIKKFIDYSDPEVARAAKKIKGDILNKEKLKKVDRLIKKELDEETKEELEKRKKNILKSEKIGFKKFFKFEVKDKNEKVNKSFLSLFKEEISKLGFTHIYILVDELEWLDDQYISTKTPINCLAANRELMHKYLKKYKTTMVFACASRIWIALMSNYKELKDIYVPPNYTSDDCIIPEYNIEDIKSILGKILNEKDAKLFSDQDIGVMLEYSNTLRQFFNLAELPYEKYLEKKKQIGPNLKYAKKIISKELNQIKIDKMFDSYKYDSIKNHLISLLVKKEKIVTKSKIDEILRLLTNLTKHIKAPRDRIATKLRSMCKGRSKGEANKIIDFLLEEEPKLLKIEKEAEKNFLTFRSGQLRRDEIESSEIEFIIVKMKSARDASNNLTKNKIVEIIKEAQEKGYFQNKTSEEIIQELIDLNKIHKVESNKYSLMINESTQSNIDKLNNFLSDNKFKEKEKRSRSSVSKGLLHLLGFLDKRIETKTTENGELSIFYNEVRFIGDMLRKKLKLGILYYNFKDYRKSRVEEIRKNYNLDYLFLCSVWDGKNLIKKDITLKKKLEKSDNKFFVDYQIDKNVCYLYFKKREHSDSGVKDVFSYIKNYSKLDESVRYDALSVIDSQLKTQLFLLKEKPEDKLKGKFKSKIILKKTVRLNNEDEKIVFKEAFIDIITRSKANIKEEYSKIFRSLKMSLTLGLISSSKFVKLANEKKSKVNNKILCQPFDLVYKSIDFEKRNSYQIFEKYFKNQGFNITSTFKKKQSSFKPNWEGILKAICEIFSETLNYEKKDNEFLFYKVKVEWDKERVKQSIEKLNEYKDLINHLFNSEEKSAYLKEIKNIIKKIETLKNLTKKDINIKLGTESHSFMLNKNLSLKERFEQVECILNTNISKDLGFFKDENYHNRLEEIDQICSFCEELFNEINEKINKLITQTNKKTDLTIEPDNYFSFFKKIKNQKETLNQKDFKSKFKKIIDLFKKIETYDDLKNHIKNEEKYCTTRTEINKFQEEIDNIGNKVDILKGRLGELPTDLYEELNEIIGKRKRLSNNLEISNIPIPDISNKDYDEISIIDIRDYEKKNSEEKKQLILELISKLIINKSSLERDEKKVKNWIKHHVSDYIKHQIVRIDRFNKFLKNYNPKSTKLKKPKFNFKQQIQGLLENLENKNNYNEFREWYAEIKEEVKNKIDNLINLEIKETGEYSDLINTVMEKSKEGKLIGYLLNQKFDLIKEKKDFREKLCKMEDLGLFKEE